MVFGYFLALVEEAHVLGHADIRSGFLAHYSFDSLEISLVVVLLVERGCESGVCGTVVIKGLVHSKKLYALPKCHQNNRCSHVVAFSFWARNGRKGRFLHQS